MTIQQTLVVEDNPDTPNLTALHFGNEGRQVDIAAGKGTRFYFRLPAAG